MREEVKENLEVEGVGENTEGDPLPNNATPKEKMVARIASLVYVNDNLLEKALDYCQEKGKETTTMESYVLKHFSYLLPLFPELQQEYLEEVMARKKKQRRIRSKRK